jgi:hypothetical protein
MALSVIFHNEGVLVSMTEDLDLGIEGDKTVKAPGKVEVSFPIGGDAQIIQIDIR